VANGVTVLVGSRNSNARGRGHGGRGGRHRASSSTLTDRVSITEAAERVHKEFGRLDLLVQNAAVSNTRKGSLSFRSTPR